jgi:N6-adenosine-specific RNA methylase IME4/ParB-like chromosome segregation protein Spo0J
MPIDAIIANGRRRRIDNDQVKSLADSIDRNGLINPITLTDDGKLLAGLHRLEACKLLRWQEIPARLVDGLNALQAELIEIDENLIRNELSPLQQGEWLTRRNEALTALGMRREVGWNGNQYTLGGETVSPPKSTSAIASEIGISERSAQQKMQIARDIAPEVKEQIYGTELEERTTDLLRIARLKPEQQAAVVEKITTGAARTVTEAARQITRESKSKIKPVTGKYRVFYADPPWQYGNTGLDDYGHAERHYPTMSIDELCQMRIKDIAEDNAVLFLWVTSPLLEECFDVIHSWGFQYKTSFVWDKVAHNFGHYNSVRHEFLLVCTRGSCTPEVKKLFDSVMSIERTDNHSEKPEEFRNIIDTIYPTGDRIELFARKQVAGWNAWGNEV